ncbi:MULTISPECIES: methyltransferase [unclassified Streptomyces]|uniref:methyltransferase n=1 Tax=unclassified Streptomyces TaxID=2593676 RepID=UPI0025532FBA|nr:MULTISPECIES: methyltransferase [unclassified Streptomyces]WRZ62820.1 methyltransferase [Streptomyces sp. NBC_01257]
MDGTGSGDEGERVMRAWRTIGPLMDLVTPMALRVAATLRLADLIADGAGQGGELARRSGTDPDALGRMMRHLVCHGVFTEPEPGRFGLNGTAELLRSEHPAELRLSLDLDGFGGTMDLAFTGLLHTVRTGEPAWETVFGAPFWPYLAAHPRMGASFDATMSAGAALVRDAAGGYDWSAARHVTDVGGGRGALLAELLDTHPGLRATLLDLPDTAARGREFLAARGLADRCEAVGQSFFDPLPAGSDVYVLNKVVHDWDDDRARALLRRCAEAAGERGRVVVIEAHGTSGADPAQFAEMDLRMLVLAGGRERGIDEYEALASAAGLRVDDVRTTPLDHVILDCAPRAASSAP